jgi:hypothetical protein
MSCGRQERYRVFLEKPGGKEILGRPRHRWEYSIKTNLQDVERGEAWTGMVWFRIGTSGGLL